MDPITLAWILLVAEVLLIATTLYMRWLNNPRLFADNKNLRRVNTKHRFFGAFNGFYDLLDRVPFLRRSGTANEWDLLKALLLTMVPIMAFNLIGQPLIVALISIDVILLLVAGILLAHPWVKSKTTR